MASVTAVAARGKVRTHAAARRSLAAAVQLAWLTVGAGASLGGSYLRRDWGDGAAPRSNGLAHAGLVSSVIVDVGNGFYGGIELDALAYFRVQSPYPLVQMASSTAPQIVLVSTPYALRVDVLLLGKRW